MIQAAVAVVKYNHKSALFHAYFFHWRCSSLLKEKLLILNLEQIHKSFSIFSQIIYTESH